MKIDLTPLERILGTPTAGFFHVASQLPSLRQAYVGVALEESGLVQAANTIANAFCDFNTGHNAQLVLNERNYYPAEGETGLAYTTYRWNKNLLKEVTGNYEENVAILQQRTDGHRPAILLATVLKLDAPKFTDTGRLKYFVEGINLPALREGLPEMERLLKLAEEKNAAKARPAPAQNVMQ